MLPTPAAQAVGGDATLAHPEDSRTAPVHADLAVERCNVVANRVVRQIELLAHLEISLALADQAENFPLTVGEHFELPRATCGGCEAQGLEPIDDIAREGRRVGEDRLHRVHR